ncbi:hypothetical protein M422DRAFT_184449 [Sphaerobolus stellatus SS14]|uniref:DUF6535 domain-containing protein n=1 Tax=Sphaerobolus stellatus (strain SS14) TaxID=990650 RepID=A0A0C9UCT2_SPHS4|nr:hypothetical protein M422DRAFT_184449 [Sphaerobolus stellatus SS14]
MIHSELFSKVPQDNTSHFWSVYHQVAKEHDQDFIDRHNSDLDSLLIFAGLFSTVNSAFIVQMQADLSPNPSSTPNALLMLLIHTIDNATFADQNLTLPQWNGPCSTIVWTQAFAYASLTASLLAAFGAVLGKQWLAHYKSTHFGHGTLEKRGKQREEKYLGIKKWKLDAFLDSLPVYCSSPFYSLEYLSPPVCGICNILLEIYL